MVVPGPPFRLPGDERIHRKCPDRQRFCSARVERALLRVPHFSRRLREVGLFVCIGKNSSCYFFLFLRTGFRKTSHASRYFSYFDRFFRLAG
jgi:hypothetical protein